MNAKRFTRFESIKIPFLIALSFFIVSIATLSHYGISWDEPIHFQRGQAYLYYFLTGEKTYDALPVVRDYIPKIEGLDINETFKGRTIVDLKPNFRRSYFQNESLNGKYFISSDSGHPPLNGILAALTNKIFYQHLGIMGDIESHHLFIVIAATVLVFVVSIFAYELYGVTASIVAGVCLSLYPLFFAESHFNIKDPPETAFIGLTIWAFWNSLNKKSWRWVVVAAFTSALALGTKFNVLFLPVIIGPYLFVRYFGDIVKFFKKPLSTVRSIPKLYMFALVASPFIVLLIFFGTWPYLWFDLWGNTASILKFYKDIGTGGIYQPQYLAIGGINTYPVYWIIITTPPVMLVLTTLGIIYSLKNIRYYRYTPLLILLWFFVPIIRISLPGTSVYGGIRQIMEYIPAMAMLSGIGAHYCVEFFKLQSKKTRSAAIVFVTLLGMLLPIVTYHPNENVYFNFLVGGLSGAREKNIPSSGNSFGNAYYQAVQWINQNVENGAELSLIQGTLTNIPNLYVRPDIKLWNGYWSAIDREGEYLIELTYDGVVTSYQYAWDYAEKFLEPVYEVKADNSAIAKVWKNDIHHTKPKYQLSVTPYTGKVTVEVFDDIISVELADEVMLNHFQIAVDMIPGCTMTQASVEISSDNVVWLSKVEQFLTHQISAPRAFDGKNAGYYFPGDRAKYIRIKTHDIKSCLLNIEAFSVTILR